jgi:DNA repair exonuclease SbcCD ATPase subunit
MHIQFEKVIIHNFLSYGHAEITLNGKGYCLVKGINKNPIDNALSNGSGKSSWSSAICWCLTGETIQGISSNVKNIHVEENSCYVSLHFKMDNTSFIITRQKEPKPDMKIFMNGQDISGKGIRESEAVLTKYLPDITSDLLSSIIILGQGLPNKFSDNKPSGRKEVLEKLSKSDFMIQDLKNRIAVRESELKDTIRKVEDKILAAESKKAVLTEQLVKFEAELAELNKPIDFDSLIQEKENIINDINKSIIELNSQLSEATMLEKDLTSKLNELNIVQSNSITELNNTFSEIKGNYIANKNKLTVDFNNTVNELKVKLNDTKTEINNSYNQEIITLTSKINSLTTTIQNIKSIKDICPTCGQKLPNVVKPDTSKEEAEIKENKEKLEVLNTGKELKITELQNTYAKKIADLKENYDKSILDIDEDFNKKLQTYNNYLADIVEEFNKNSTEIKQKLTEIKPTINTVNLSIRDKQSILLNETKELTEIKFKKQNHLEKITKVQDSLESTQNNIKILFEEILYNNNDKDSLNSSLGIINKMISLVKRDFRGFLLGNVINFIDNKAKEYSKEIFGTNLLDFKLDGNNIEISYASKAFENLSGGEKQKVDLIIQFAIRDMMSQYLDFSSNIIILDEIFDNLDSLGCNNLINLVSHKLNDVESVFIVSHHADELCIPYDCEMVIIKNELGISKVN